MESQDALELEMAISDLARAVLSLENTLSKSLDKLTQAVYTIGE